MIFNRHTIPNVLAALRRAVHRILFEPKRLSVPMEEFDRRIHACEQCDRLVKDSRQCMECTCFVDLKAWMSTERCPLKRW